MFSKLIGIAISSLLIWLLSYIKILKFTTLNCYMIIGIMIILNIIFYLKKKDKINITRENIKNIISIEILFFVVLILWMLYRSFFVGLDSSTEQFMNYGFMNAIMNSEYMPVEDIWFSGYHINYYYFGHYISVFISKISFLQVNEGYNVMMALVASLTFILPYSIAYNLGAMLIKEKQEKKKTNKFIPYIIAILTALSISIGGTLVFPIYKFGTAKDITNYDYTYVRNFIGYRPETKDKTITEIPAYSNVVKDLHAHYIDTMFVFTTLALLLQIITSEKEESKKKRLLNSTILLQGIILGIQKMTNYWDFPIYLVVISIIIIINNLLKYNQLNQSILIGITQIIEIISIEELVTLPFTIDLNMITTQVCLTHIISPLYKFLILWGFPILIIIIFLLNIVNELLINKKEKKLLQNIRSLQISDVYVAILGLCAIGLVFIPELIYLKDIYGEEYKRANTMFKLTFQAYIMFSIALNYIFIKFIYDKEVAIKKIFSIILLMIYITTFGYGFDAMKTRLQDKTFGNLANSEFYIKEKYPDDYEAIQWIKSNLGRSEVILENASASFQISSRISVFTANPTVLGWHGHEWLWRADENYIYSVEQGRRWEDILTIYSSDDIKSIKKLIKRYNISYIYIGNVEFQENKNLNRDVLLKLGKIVYKDDKDYTLTPVYIIKVK